MDNNALIMHANDNVAIALQPIQKGEAVIAEERQLLITTENIDLAHKIALVRIAEGDKVIRYGEPIVETTREIEAGEWVHVHNTRPIPGGTTQESA